MRMLKALTAALLVIVAGGAQAVGRWTEIDRTVLPYEATEIATYRWTLSSATGTSPMLDTRSCSSIGAEWDQALLSGSTTGAASLFSCPAATSAESECVSRGLMRSAVPVGNTLASSYLSFPGTGSTAAYLMAKVTTAGLDTVVQVNCYRKLAGLRARDIMRHDDVERVRLTFGAASDSSCANAACTPNDSLTPTWVRAVIGTPTADTFARPATFGQDGEAVIDPGDATSANEGVQYALPFHGSLRLETAQRLGRRGASFYARFLLARTGTTAHTAVGMCGIGETDSQRMLLTSAGAFGATGPAIAVRWDAGGTFTVNLNGGSPALTVTTAETYQVDARVAIEIGTTPITELQTDIAGNWQIRPLTTDQQQPRGVGVWVSGVLVTVIEESEYLGPTFAADNLTPCVSVVNVGGTSDNVFLMDVQFDQDREFALPETF